VSSPEEPLWRSTPLNPSQPPDKRKVRPITVVLLAVIAIVVLCVGGLAAIGALVGGGPKATAVMVMPSSSPATPSPTAAAPATSVTSARPATTTHVSVTSARASARPKPKPTTKKPTPKPTTPVVQMGVRAGAFCSPQGAFGLTKTGMLMRCKPSAKDGRDRWRKA
jgi:hypothetical protein